MFIDKIWSNDVAEYRPDVAGSQYMKVRRFNLLIGPNNSGKSRFLRKLFASQSANQQFGLGYEFRSVMESLGTIFEALQKGPTIGHLDVSELLSAYNGECLRRSIITEKIDSFIRAVQECAQSGYSMHGGVLAVYNAVKFAAGHGQMPTKALNDLGALSSRLSHMRSYYIPILRGMRPLSEGDLFKERTIKDYFSGAKPEIVTGFDLYNLLVSNLLGQPDQRARIRQYEKILGDEFFGGAEITLIPEHGKDTVAVKIGEDNQFPIYNLGDGLQQVIIITSVAFLEREFSLFFIEEPEACLHPGLLRKLVMFLLNHTKHQYVATTHSNHLLDLAESHEDVLIYRVSKVGIGGDSSFKISECTRDRELLNELGVLASSVYLANSTIWVEGITDRLYISSFMRRFLRDLPDDTLRKRYEGYLENFHYAFIEYQGGTLSHWGFDDQELVDRLSASSVCATAFLIADGDIEGKGERAEILERELGERFHLLSCKEIENLLPLQVVLKTAENIFDRKRAKTVAGLDKENLKKILARKVRDSKQGIGYHLDVCLGLPGKGKDAPRVFADASGTIGDKVKFCREAIAIMSEDDWEMPVEIKELCALIFAHVAMSN